MKLTGRCPASLALPARGGQVDGVMGYKVTIVPGGEGPPWGRGGSLWNFLPVSLKRQDHFCTRKSLFVQPLTF